MAELLDFCKALAAMLEPAEHLRVHGGLTLEPIEQTYVVKKPDPLTD